MEEREVEYIRRWIDWLAHYTDDPGLYGCGRTKEEALENLKKSDKAYQVYSEKHGRRP
jgi:predicted RNase H-like HicB family nuclease